MSSKLFESRLSLSKNRLDDLKVNYRLLNQRQDCAIETPTTSNGRSLYAFRNAATGASNCGTSVLLNNVF
jgi:hypothetical protein